MRSDPRSGRWSALALGALVLCCSPQPGGGEDRASAGAPARARAQAEAKGQEPGGGKRKLALLVGINAYRYARPQLAGALNDLDEMQAVLRSPAYGFKDGDIRVLRDQEATRVGILGALDDLVARSRAGDIAVFYFSGHGSLCDDADDPTGMDNTIVPYDARDPAGEMGDIRDKELNVRVRQLSAKVGDRGGVTLILDSCHSGTGARAAGTPRSIEKGPSCGGSTVVAAKYRHWLETWGPQGSGYADDDIRYTLIAGSRTDQTSFERVSTDGKTRGALTEHLARTLLQPWATKRSYRDVMDRVIPAVNGEFATQVPQLEGRNADQAVFGAEMIGTRNYVTLSPGAAGEVTLEGGSAYGFTSGSQFDIYGPEAHAFEPPEQPLTRATIRTVEPLRSIARISPVVKIPQGAKAIERQHRYGAQKPRLRYDGLERSAALRRLKEVLDTYPDRPFESVAAGQPFQIRLVEESGLVRTFGADGEELSRGLAVTEPSLTPLLEQRVLDWIRWFGLLSLRNPTAAERVELKLVPRGETQPASSPAFKPGTGQFDLKLRNLTKRRQFIYILDLTSRGSARRVFPLDPGSNVPLEPLQETTLGPWNTSLPQGTRYLRDTFKLIASTGQIDLRFLEMETPKGELRSGRPDDPLNRLIFELGNGRRDGDMEVVPDWATSEATFEVCEALDPKGRCLGPAVTAQRQQVRPSQVAARP